MKNTDDLIDGIPVDQQAGEAGLCKGSGNFLVALVDVHGLQFDAMRQNFRRRQVAELKGVAQQLTLIFRQCRRPAPRPPRYKLLRCQAPWLQSRC